VHGGKDFGVVVEDLTDGPVSGTIVTDDPGQPVIAGLKTQHGFHFPTHPCSPLGFCIATTRIGVRCFSSMPAGQNQPQDLSATETN
jgi:hypothetical protein